MRVSDILRTKGNTLHTLSPEQTVWAAVQTMAVHDIGSVVVVNHGKLAGILTLREVVNALHTHGGHIGNGIGRGIMKRGPQTVSPSTDVNAARHMTMEPHAPYLPLLHGHTLRRGISFYSVGNAV